MPTIGQLLLLFAAIIALLRDRRRNVDLRAWSDHPVPRLLSRILLVLGILACAGVIVWHSADRGAWLPVGDNFDALVWLATLLAMFVLYVQHRKQLGSLDWYVMPLVIVLLVTAAIFGRADYHAYDSTVRDTWAWTHRVTAYGGAVAFAIAAAAGAPCTSAQKPALRSKTPVGPQFGAASGTPSST